MRANNELVASATVFDARRANNNEPAASATVFDARSTSDQQSSRTNEPNASEPEIKPVIPKRHWY